jgi:hypothetical protein
MRLYILIFQQILYVQLVYVWLTCVPHLMTVHSRTYCNMKQEVLRRTNRLFTFDDIRTG